MAAAYPVWILAQVFRNTCASIMQEGTMVRMRLCLAWYAGKGLNEHSAVYRRNAEDNTVVCGPHVLDSRADVTAIGRFSGRRRRGVAPPPKSPPNILPTPPAGVFSPPMLHMDGLGSDPWIEAQIDAAVAPYAAKLPAEEIAWMRDRLAEALATERRGQELLRRARPRVVERSGAVSTGAAEQAEARPAVRRGRAG